MVDPEQPAALATSESIVLDGANGVTPAPRHHFPQATVWLVLGLLVAAAVKGLLRGKASVIALLSLGFALPGLLHVCLLRADAPFRRAAMGDAIEATLADMQAKAPWPRHSVKVVSEADDVLFPLARYAIPSRPPADEGAIELKILGGPLGQLCREEAPSTVTCGSAE